jgi:hypothetical protein
MKIKLAQGNLGFNLALSGGLLPPLDCLVKVLRHAIAVGIGITDAVFGQRVTLCRRLSIPLKCRRDVFFNTESARVIGAEVGFGIDITFFRRLAQAFRRPGIILRDAIAPRVTLGEFIFRTGVSFCSRKLDGLKLRAWRVDTASNGQNQKHNACQPHDWIQKMMDD